MADDGVTATAGDSDRHRKHKKHKHRHRRRHHRDDRERAGHGSDDDGRPFSEVKKAAADEHGEHMVDAGVRCVEGDDSQREISLAHTGISDRHRDDDRWQDGDGRHDQRHDDRRYHDHRRYDSRRHGDGRYDDRRYGDRRHDSHRQHTDRRSDAHQWQQHARRRRSRSRSSSSDSLERHRRRRQKAVQEAAEKPQRFWDGFQWVDSAPEVTGSQIHGALGHATRKDRRLYVGNLPLNVGLTEKQIGEYITHQLRAQKKIVMDAPNPLHSVWLAPEQTYAFVELLTVEAANMVMSLNGTMLLQNVLRISRPNNYNVNIGMPVDPTAAATVGAHAGGIGASVVGVFASPPVVSGGQPEAAAAAARATTSDVSVAMASATAAAATAKGSNGPVATSAVVSCSSMLTAAELVSAEERTAIKEDVAEECSKFGRVEAIKVPVSDNVSCKVFVRFDTIEAARAAMAALDGRMFDGRQISVGSLSLADFDALADGA